MAYKNNIHETFLLQASSPLKRKNLASKLSKRPGEINSLTAYHDFRRVKSINKYLAKIYIIAWIRWVSHMLKMSKWEIQKRIKNSPIWKSVDVKNTIVQQNLDDAKSIPKLDLGLEKETYFLQRKWYIIRKDSEIEQNNVQNNNYRWDIILFLLTLWIIVMFSLVSLYFILLIPIVIAFHCLFRSNFMAPLLALIPTLEKNIYHITWIIICVLIIFIWFVTWSVQKDIQVIYTYFPHNSAETSSRYFPEEVYNHYSKKEISREDLVKILVSARNIDIAKERWIECFKDVFQSEHPWEICYAKDAWYIQWDALWNFYPQQAISHAAGLKLILKFYNLNVPSSSLYLTYDDLQKNQWYTRYAEYAKRIWLIEQDVKEFKPTENISIQQVDSYIYTLSKR